MSSLAEALPLEIERVIEVRRQFEELRGLPNVIVEPQITMLNASISRALKASTSGDVVEMIRAYEELKGWES